MLIEIMTPLVKKTFQLVGWDIRKLVDSFADISDEDMDIITYASPYSMTTVERLYALIEATKYIEKHNIKGDIVECGVWRGGSMMGVARTLVGLSRTDKNLYLFDTFKGMTEPTEKDIDIRGMSATEKFRKYKDGSGASTWSRASVEEVKKNMYSTGYTTTRIFFIEGKVEDTLPDNAPEKISLLRLDTDWYESTKHEMTHLFPRLSRGGVMIVDDYGHWRGARQAVDEYLGDNCVSILLNRIDYSCRLGVKN